MEESQQLPLAAKLCADILMGTLGNHIQGGPLVQDVSPTNSAQRSKSSLLRVIERSKVSGNPFRNNSFPTELRSREVPLPLKDAPKAMVPYSPLLRTSLILSFASSQLLHLPLSFQSTRTVWLQNIASTN